jgi:hypothetical protein
MSTVGAHTAKVRAEDNISAITGLGKYRIGALLMARLTWRTRMDLMHECDVRAFGPAMEPASNFLLAALPRDDAQRLWPYLEHVHLTQGAALYANGLPPSHSYFPITAVIALQCGPSDGRAGDFAVIGHEGVVGSPSFTRSDLSLVRAEVRCTADAFRLHQTLLADDWGHAGGANARACGTAARSTHSGSPGALRVTADLRRAATRPSLRALAPCAPRRSPHSR